jgi:hypothetical protein
VWVPTPSKSYTSRNRNRHPTSGTHGNPTGTDGTHTGTHTPSKTALWVPVWGPIGTHESRNPQCSGRDAQAETESRRSHSPTIGGNEPGTPQTGSNRIYSGNKTGRDSRHARARGMEEHTFSCQPEVSEGGHSPPRSTGHIILRRGTDNSRVNGPGRGVRTTLALTTRQ